MSPAFDYRPPFVNPEFLDSLDALRFNAAAEKYNKKAIAPSNADTSVGQAASSGYMGNVAIVAPPLPQPAVQSQLHEGKVFLVWKEYGGEPTHKHDTLASAEKEADRLARLNPGAKFYVLSTIESVVVPVQPKPAGLWRSAR